MLRTAKIFEYEELTEDENEDENIDYSLVWNCKRKKVINCVTEIIANLHPSDIRICLQVS